MYRYLSLEKESYNFCVVFTYAIRRAREIRKFHVVVVQRWQRNVQNSVIHVQSCCLLVNILFFAVLLAVAVVVGFVIQKKCYRSNVTSHFSSLFWQKPQPRNQRKMRRSRLTPRQVRERTWERGGHLQYSIHVKELGSILLRHRIKKILYPD